MTVDNSSKSNNKEPSPSASVDGGGDLKPSTLQLEHISKANFVASFPAAAKKQALRKIDVRLLPVLTFLYVLSYLDRSNIANAEIEVNPPSYLSKGVC